MGSIRLEVTQAQPTDLEGERYSGELIHHGPYTIINVAGSGRGWVFWNGNQGQGRYIAGRESMALTITYKGQGHYSYELAGSAPMAYSGRISENMPKAFARVEGMPEPLQGLGG